MICLLKQCPFVQFGLLDVPGLNDFENIADGDQDDDDNDDDLEAELLALTSGKSPKPPKRGESYILYGTFSDRHELIPPIPNH